MTLYDLCGHHLFSGIEMFSTPDEYGLTRSGVRFIFDGVSYEVLEDPSDGYRSYLGEIYESDSLPAYLFPVSVPVICHMDDSQDSEILCVRDILNGVVIMRIGTDYYDDYYPQCILEYYPENMSVNRKGE